MKAFLGVAIAAALSFACLLATPPFGGTVAAQTAEISVGSLKITQPWSRATPNGATVASGYLRITNTGKEADRLVSISSAVAERASVHEMTMQDNIMKMRALPNGLEIPSGGSVELKPSGYHVMFEKLKAPLKEGSHFTTTLTFAKAGTVDVDMVVLGIGAMQPGMSSPMPGMTH